MPINSEKTTGQAVLPATSDGFAAVDALVALTMLATTIVLALGAGDGARKAAAAALETQRARTMLAGLMNTPMPPGERSGVDWALEWRLAVAAPSTTQDVRPVRLCRREALVSSRATRRRYAANSVEVCLEREAT